MAVRTRTPRTALGAGELILHRWAGNHRRGVLDAIGGHLYLTNRRLLFQPHWFERLFDRGTWELPHSAVDQACVVRMKIGRLSRPGRLRLVIHVRDESKHVFTVRKADAVAAAIERALEQPRGRYN
jgi:hypothetical protein